MKKMMASTILLALVITACAEQKRDRLQGTPAGNSQTQERPTSTSSTGTNGTTVSTGTIQNGGTVADANGQNGNSGQANANNQTGSAGQNIATTSASGDQSTSTIQGPSTGLERVTQPSYEVSFSSGSSQDLGSMVVGNETGMPSAAFTSSVTCLENANDINTYLRPISGANGIANRITMLGGSQLFYLHAEQSSASRVPVRIRCGRSDAAVGDVMTGALGESLRQNANLSVIDLSDTVSYRRGFFAILDRSANANPLAFTITCNSANLAQAVFGKSIYLRLEAGSQVIFQKKSDDGARDLAYLVRCSVAQASSATGGNSNLTPVSGDASISVRTASNDTTTANRISASGDASESNTRDEDAGE